MKQLIWILALCTTLLFTTCGDDDPQIIEEEEVPYEWVVSHTIDEFLTAFQENEVTVDTIAIVGIVISSDENGGIEDELYIKDETGALVIDVDESDLYQTFPQGTEILIKCVGLKADVDGRRLAQADGSAITLEGLEDDAIIKTGETDNVSAKSVNPTALSDEDLNQYVVFGGYQLDEAAVGQTFVIDSDETTWEVFNSDEETMTLFFRPEMSFGDEEIPNGAGSVRGLYVKRDGQNVILPMSFDDLDFNLKRRAPFVKRTFELGDNSLPYQIMFPRDYDETASYPLIVFLHGAGERGNNNTAQMGYGTQTFGSYESRTDYPAIVIYPQCPSDVMWSRRIKYTDDNDVLIFEFPVEDEPNYAMEMVIELVKTLISEEGVDESRIYVTGLSMGGIGTFEFMYYAPGLAAAGISMAGGHDPELLSTYGGLSTFRLYHGADDPVVPARYSQGMYDKMVELEIDALYSEAEGRGHEWNYVLNDPEYLEWMFSQQNE